MPGSKPGALPLGDTPKNSKLFYKIMRKARFELAHLRYQNLNLVRLPISPLPQIMVATTGIEPVTSAL